MIKAVTFDLWNTLLENKDFTEQRINSLKRDLEVEGLIFPDSELLRAYDSASDHSQGMGAKSHPPKRGEKGRAHFKRVKDPVHSGPETISQC